MAHKAVNAIIHGRVQGVNYRMSTLEQARHLQVAGWVRNCADGTVEVWAQGPEEQVNQLLDWCRQGPPAAHVSEVEIKPATLQPHLQDFSVR